MLNRLRFYPPMLAVIVTVFVHLNVACLAPAKDPPKPIRDWTVAPAIVELDQPHDLYLVGDVHGDYDRLAKLLAAAKLIEKPLKHPKDVRWVGGPAVVVCTGDLIDKGKHSLKVISLFRHLQEAAQTSHGRVIVTMGNHEAEFLASGAKDDKAEEFLKELDKHGLDPNDVANERDSQGAGRFMASLPFAARIGDWFCAHACNTDGRTLATLRKKLMDGVDADGYDAAILSDPKSLLQARLHDIPWWEEPGDTADESEARLHDYATALGVKHFVMGHQPGKAVFSDGTKRHQGELLQKFDGLIFLIDVGMSEAIDYSQGAMLHIAESGGQQIATVVLPDGTSKEIWKSK